MPQLGPPHRGILFRLDSNCRLEGGEESTIILLWLVLIPLKPREVKFERVRR
jgi:hypothetical protein